MKTLILALGVICGTVGAACAQELPNWNISGQDWVCSQKCQRRSCRKTYPYCTRRSDVRILRTKAGDI